MIGGLITKNIDVVVPCYNEEEVLNLFYTETEKIAKSIQGYNFTYIFVDDGSKDNTLMTILQLAKENDNVKYISFSRNFGKEAGMYAGLQATTGDYVIIMDADLQHPPTLFPAMIKSMEEGHDCCAARRTTRKGEAPIRSMFSRMFYRLNNKICDVDLVQGAVDYRIMTRQMVDSILELSEVQRFSKGIFAWVGFDTEWIPYENVERTVGTTKWSFTGLFKYAVDGITAFSITPLRMVTGMGFTISIFAFIYIIVTLIQTFVYGIDVPGYVTTLSAVLFLGGIIEFSLGILGEYIAHIYMEAKDRPIYITKTSNIERKDKK
ncbi:MAG: glycosyltransferase family 2 protein [Lachnospiraceae bacterium]|nr:glycosyltransferase family 2 protein [Lachnospiraceae bacterium]MBQ4068228.1 glycosyltransferase family 2 protein [Lachnospiraceae bacterium]